MFEVPVPPESLLQQLLSSPTVFVQVVNPASKSSKLIIVGGGGGGPHQLFKNLGNDNNWIEIDLEGTTSNRDGVGTLVFVTTGDITQFREQTGGVHFRAQNHQRIHFGLGDNDHIDRILIKWPSGIVHSIENVPVNKILEIKEPMTP